MEKVIPWRLLPLSVFDGATSAVGTKATVREALLRLRSDELKGQIEMLRAASGDEREALKKRLPAVTFAGLFRRRRREDMVSMTGLLVADLDHLDAAMMPELMERAKVDPHVAAAFISPSGAGAKLVFRVPRIEDGPGFTAANAMACHASSYAAVEQHVRDVYSLDIDPSGKDTTRLCFLSHDPGAHLNAEAVELPHLNAPMTAERAVKVKPGVAQQRAEIAARVLGLTISDFDAVDGGKWKFRCPWEEEHTTPSAVDAVFWAAPPTLSCFHSSCRGHYDSANRQLRVQLGRMERRHEAKPVRHEADLGGVRVSQIASEALVSRPLLIDFRGIYPSLARTVEGLSEGDLMVVLAATSVGKSTVLLDIADGSKPTPAMYFDLELGRVAFGRRLAARHAGQSVRELRSVLGATVDAELAEQLERAYPNLRHYVGREAARHENMLAAIRHVADREGRAPLVILDYVQLMTGGGDASRYDDVSSAMERFRTMASEESCAFIIASQVRRSEGDASPQSRPVSLTSGKESGSVENSASVVLGVWVPKDGENPNWKLRRCRVLKNSNDVPYDTFDLVAESPFHFSDPGLTVPGSLLAD